MISKTSLFNKGIYKSTLRRYMWGSILYFILLFISTGMMIMLNENPDLPNVYWSARSFSTLLSAEYMIIPMLFSVVVPTVAGLMVFRFIHSKKASVFVHSLPVKRSANYISSVLAMLTLMLAPVLLNGAILMIMSLCRYSLHFTVLDCIVWILLNSFSLFVFFSCACFVSVLTGNSFAMFGLNILFHCISLIFAAVFTVISELFLCGFAGESALIQKAFEWSFITRIPTMMTDWCYAIGENLNGYRVNVITFIITALIFYVISGFLYSKRRMETAEDVAGFSCLNHILKYLVTFIGAIVSFALISPAIYGKSIVLWLVVIIVSAVIYFGSEMILRKTMKVWSSYKGYLAFLAGFAVVLSIFAFTSFFGFETKLPDSEKIENIAVYNYYRQEKPFVSSDEIINKAIKAHAQLVEENYIIVPDEYDTRIHFEYELKNGKIMHRAYRIDEKTLNEIMDSLYENREYKEKSEEIYASAENYIDIALQGGDYTTLEDEKMEELIGCIKEDIYNLSYSQLHNSGWTIGVEIRYIPKRVKNEAEQTEPSERIQYMYQSINMNYENTVKWLKENDCWESLRVKKQGEFYISKERDFLPFEDGDMDNERANFLKIEQGEDFDKIIGFIENDRPGYIPEEMILRIYHMNNDSEKNYTLISVASADDLKELFPDKGIDKLMER